MSFARRITSTAHVAVLVAALVAAFITPMAVAGAQVKVELRDAGPGSAAEILGRALAAPHSVIPPQANKYVIPADSVRAQTVIALGTTVVVEGTVHGDLIVVGGDLYMHPGGTVDGRAMAIGGGVYESMLGHTGSVVAFRDFTYDVSPMSGGYSLSYRSLEETSTTPTFSRTGFQGVQIPSYDRSNGLSLPFAGLIAVPHSGVRIVPSLTYRSQLGRVDPMVSVLAPLDRRTTVRLEAGRGTFSNDDWIRSDVVNSAEYFLVGDDARNYYRASRAKVTLSRQWESESAMLEPFIGGLVERGTSVRPGLNAAGGPWALLNRHDSDDVLRPNPAIDPGTTTSMVAGAAWRWSADAMDARATVNEEVGKFSSKAGFSSPAGAFAQTTIDAKITFPTFGSQSLGFNGHGVFTGGAEPRQRWAYIGGPGSIPTLDLLQRGGNHLLYIDARYAIPFERVEVPMVGSPIITLREILAGAAENRFPSLSQAAGVRVSVGFVYGELLVDPVSHHRYTGFGISLDQ